MSINLSFENQLCVYEQPLSERIRLFMRLETMFFQMKKFYNANEYYSIQLFLDALFDVLDFLHRYEIRSEIIKELQSYKLAIERGYFGINWLEEEREITLENINHSVQEAHDINFNPISSLRENELFNSLRQRNFNQSGNCLFEVPAYQHWLLQNSKQENHFLEHCYQLFTPIVQAINLLLRLVRAGAEMTEEYAADGMFLKTLDNHKRHQMLRIHLSPEDNVFPRISGDRHRFSIRFMSQNDPKNRAQQINSPVHFSLQTCVL